MLQSLIQNEDAREGIAHVLELLGQGILVVDDTDRVVVCNSESQRMLGLQGKTVLLPRWGEVFQVFGADQVTPVAEEDFPLFQAMHGETVKSREVFVKHAGAPAGQWLGIEARPLRPSGRLAKGAILVCSDRSETKQAEFDQRRDQERIQRALRESEAFYHSLVEHLPQNIFRKDCDGRVTFANGNYCATMHKTLKELLGLTDYDLFPARLAKKYVEDDRRVMETRKVFEAVEEHLTADGQRIHVQVIKTPITDEADKVIGTQGMFWDVSERIQHEETLAKSERRYRQLTEATQDAIIVTDAQGAVTLFNPAAERTFGREASSVMGRKLLDLIPDELQEGAGPKLSKRLVHQLATDAGRPVEMTGRRQDGSTFPLEIALSVIDGQASDSSEVQFLAAIRDLTERTRIRAMLVQNEKLASIGLLSAGVAHEINNPLAFVANNLAVLERDNKGLMEILNLFEAQMPTLDKVNPEAAARLAQLGEDIDLPYIRDNLGRLLNRTREGVDRVTRIVHSLRGLARTDSPKKTETDVAELINSTLEILRGRLKRNQVTVLTTFDPRSQIACVQTQISQVILNLLVNAVQAVEATARMDGQVSVETRRQDEELVIEVADNGTGIAPANLSRLFDPFFTTKDVGEGTGLGLSIAYNIVRGHGGRIEVESQVGQGTRFCVILPCNPGGKPS